MQKVKPWALHTHRGDVHKGFVVKRDGGGLLRAFRRNRGPEIPTTNSDTATCQAILCFVHFCRTTHVNATHNRPEPRNFEPVVEY